MVDVVDPNVFETANAGFAQVMYEEFLRDPAAVGPEWRRLFESGIVGERPDGNGATAPRPAVAAALPTAAAPAAAVPTAAAPLALDHHLASARRIRHQGPRRQARRQHEREPDRAHRDHASACCRSACWKKRRKRLNQALQAAGKPGKISFTHLIAFALVQATKQHPVMGHTAGPRRCPVPGRARGHRARARGRRAAEGREPRPRRAGHQAGRHDGLRARSTRPTRRWSRRPAPTGSCPTTSPAPRCRSPTPAGSAPSRRCRGSWPARAASSRSARSAIRPSSRRCRRSGSASSASARS